MDEIYVIKTFDPDNGKSGRIIKAYRDIEKAWKWMDDRNEEGCGDWYIVEVVEFDNA